MLVSADGHIAGPNGEFDWHTVDDDFSRYIDEMLRSIDMIVMGRVTGRRSAPMSRLGGITADTTLLPKST